MELNDEEREALSQVTRILRERFGATEILLYGSAARGQMNAESDINLLAVFPRVDGKLRKEIIDAIFEIELEGGRVFSVDCFSEEEMEHSPLRSSPLVLNARREGRPL
jgi:predicted nucleotidyltransferase